ncbi:permease of the major facilitator superfamily [Lasiodiplodia theobromae]|uniref:Permease of the major facilitator superfamily n=1 Tax=Lasiodiplodia theobromae TaxID=45133 RepID=A0A8H7MA01_9PEZI|nr:permease of the major facilitator superfamily [Lasiodiplodia theobromae]
MAAAQTKSFNVRVDPSTTITDGDEPDTQISKKAPERHGWLHWHDPGTSKAEKRLIFKLDWFLLSFGCLCFFIKQLDGNNISNAYVSGMKDELGFGPGNELSWMNTFFNIGQIVGGPWVNLVISVVRPRYWLTSCLMIWSLFVLFLYKCNTAKQFYALRFCIGLFESAAWPGIQYVLGSWYKKSELARRSSLFVMSGVLGQMFSGYLQSALYKGMQGKGGLSAWRWLFIFDFLLSIPVVIYGLIFFPDTPQTTQAFYLTEWEKKRSIERIDSEGRSPVGKFDYTVFRRIFMSWQLYTFSLAWFLWSFTAGSYIIQFFQLWLKAENYPVTQINNIPTALGAVNFFFMISTGIVSDKLGRRGPVALAVGTLLALCYAVFVVWHVPSKLKMAAFILSGCYGCFSPLLAGWANSVCGGDQQLRAFLLGFMNSFGNGLVIPYQQYVFPSSKAPQFAGTHAWTSGLVFVVLLTLACGFGIDFVQGFFEKRKDTTGEDHSDEA